MILPRFERRVFLSLLLLPFDSAAKIIAVVCPGSVRVRTRWGRSLVPRLLLLTTQQSILHGKVSKISANKRDAGPKIF
jgi:hypothetical protein